MSRMLEWITWWQSATLGTRWHTLLHGERVGEDASGNVYYRTRGGKIDTRLGFERRWVIYNGPSEASKVPTDWHGWLHHTFDLPPTEQRGIERPWLKPHQPNLTGTALAYRPPGSLARGGQRPRATGDYEAWSPEG